MVMAEAIASDMTKRPKTDAIILKLQLEGRKRTSQSVLKSGQLRDARHRR